MADENTSPLGQVAALEAKIAELQKTIDEQQAKATATEADLAAAKVKLDALKAVTETPDQDRLTRLELWVKAARAALPSLPAL